MPRFRRLVVPGYPHHVTQRGVRRQRTFFCETDYLEYIRLLRKYKDEAGVSIWAYCLMPNHVHVVVVPEAEDSLAQFFRAVHQRYAKRTNEMNEWKGHLWQKRFYSVALDEQHAMTAMQYVELNPVRAALCDEAVGWPWSSARGHLGCVSDDLLDTEVTCHMVSNWKTFLSDRTYQDDVGALREKTTIGRPIGNDHFIDTLEKTTGRRIRLRRRGPRPFAR